MIFRNSTIYNQREQGLRKHPRVENIAPWLLLIEIVQPVTVSYCNRTERSEAVISVEYHFLNGATLHENLHVIPVTHPLLI
jgi:hypothetical protein